MNLTNYGIMDEQVHLRVHVCVIAQKAYAFIPGNARKAIEAGNYRLISVRPPWAGGQETARGYCVPVRDIIGIQCFDVPDLIKAQNFSQTDNPSVGGKKAQNVVVQMARQGIFCPPCEPEVIGDEERQIAHIDLLLWNVFQMQVKLDSKGGVHPQATGNLFLQTCERNIGFI